MRLSSAELILTMGVCRNGESKLGCNDCKLHPLLLPFSPQDSHWLRIDHKNLWLTPQSGQVWGYNPPNRYRLVYGTQWLTLNEEPELTYLGTIPRHHENYFLSSERFL